MALINKFPLLEELELSLCSDLSDQNVFEVIAKSCPKLKHFLHIKRRYESHDWNGMAGMAMSIAGMHGLRSLELHGNHLDDQGLIAIVDNCPYLELLILRDCPHVIMDNTLLAKCARIDTVMMLRGDEYDDHYQVSTASSGRSCWTCRCFIFEPIPSMPLKIPGLPSKPSKFSFSPHCHQIKILIPSLPFRQLSVMWLLGSM